MAFRRFGKPRYFRKRKISSVDIEPIISIDTPVNGEPVGSINKASNKVPAITETGIAKKKYKRRVPAAVDSKRHPVKRKGPPSK